MGPGGAWYRSGRAAAAVRPLPSAPHGAPYSNLLPSSCSMMYFLTLASSMPTVLT